MLQTAEGPSFTENGYRRRVQRLLLKRRSDVLATLEQFGALRAAARASTTEDALTHGDPTEGNILRDSHRNLYLIDWGGVALGPPERDLVFFTGERFALFLGEYASVYKPPTLHEELFAFYLYRWILQEISDYTTRIFYRDRTPEESEHHWARLQPYLPIRHDEVQAGLRAIREVIRGL